MEENIHERESILMFSEVNVREKYRLLSHSLSSSAQLIYEINESPYLKTSVSI